VLVIELLGSYLSTSTHINNTLRYEYQFTGLSKRSKIVLSLSKY
jgi:hypothetical protein